MNPLKHVDWKVVVSVVVGAYAIALIEAVTPDFAPSGVAAKASHATARATA